MIALLIFGTWTLMAVVLVLFLTLSTRCNVFWRRSIAPGHSEDKDLSVDLPRSIVLLMLSGLMAVAMVWVTGGNVLLVLMTPLGLTMSLFCCVMGLLFGVRKLVMRKQRILAVLWIAFLLPPTAISTLRVMDLTLFIDVTVERGAFTGSKIFHFSNFTSLIVEGGSVEYAFKHYNRSRGDMLHVPYDVLELRIDGRQRVVSDRGCKNRELAIDGKKYTVTAALRLGAKGSPSTDESVRHPGLPSQIPE